MDSATQTSGHPNAPAVAWYVAALESLVSVVQELSRAHDVDAIASIVRDAARQLTGADGATFVLRDGDQCYYVDENAISPLWKGRRFPMDMCISGWVMHNATSTVIADIYNDPRIPADAYRPTFVKSLAMVPIRRIAPIGAIGNYWATHREPTQEEVAILQALADATSIALQNAQLYAELQQQLRTLDAQRERIHEQRDALEVFTRALAHDLTEPVRTIRSFSQIIQRQNVPAENAQQYFNYIQRAADRMGMLIDTVFSYTQLDDCSRTIKEHCSLTGTLQTVKKNLHHLIRERNATVTSDALPDVHANPVQMMLALQNLVANAIHHSDKPVHIHVRAEAQADEWLLSVRDNGPGIDPEHKDKIFLPFKRLKARADCAGLGLAICRKAVVSQDGRIWFESTPGQGTTFYLALPKTAPTVTGTEEASIVIPSPPLAPPTDTARPATVLLVDDLEDHLELSRLLLFPKTELTCNLLTARDGKEALAITRQAIRSRGRIDLILLDINMPGMDGFEVMEQLRQDENLKDIAVIMCTGSNYVKDRQRAESLGAAGYIVKPPSWDQLKTMIDDIPGLVYHDGIGGGTLLRAM